MGDKDSGLTLEKRNEIIDEALKEHYRETMERKRVPSDYLLMYTEGGEANAVAGAIEEATLKQERERIMKILIPRDDLEDLPISCRICLRPVVQALKAG